MDFHFNPLSLILILGSVIIFMSTVFILRRGRKPVAGYVVATNVFILLYVFGYGMELGQSSVEGVLFWLKFEYLGVTLIPAGLFLLALAFTSKEKLLTPFLRVILFIIPVITIGLAWTNEQHECIWKDLSLRMEGMTSIAEFSAGGWYWIFVGFMYLVILMSVAVLVRTIPRVPYLYRRQIRTMLIGILIPVATTGIYHVIIAINQTESGLNWQAFALIVTALVISEGVFSTYLFDLIPVAHNLIFENMEDIVIIADEQNRIIDLNPAAEKRLDKKRHEMIGDPLEQHLNAAQKTYFNRYAETPYAQAEIQIGRQYYDMLLTTFHIHKRSKAGRLLVLRNITERMISEKALRDNEQRYYSLFEHTNDAIFILGLDLDHLAVNKRAADLLGYAQEELVGLNVRDLVAPEELPLSFERQRQLHENQVIPVYERTFLRKDGRQITLELNVSLIRDDAGNPLYIQSVGRDITERAQILEQLKLQATALENAANGIVITDTKGTIIWVNPAFTRLTGYSYEEAIGQNPRILKSGQQDEKAYQELWETILAGKVWIGQIINRRKDGSLYHEEMTIAPVLDDEGKVNRFVAVKQDVSARVEAEAKLQYLATHDSLTDLPNRLLLNDRLEHAIDKALRNQTQVAVLFIDVDHFKTINDQFGHQAGDDLLNFVAEKLKKSLRQSDTLARWGGDEFAIVLEDIKTKEDVLPILDKIIKETSTVFEIGHEKIEVCISIGVSLFPFAGETANSLLSSADKAMYYAKQVSKSRYAFFSDITP